MMAISKPNSSPAAAATTVYVNALPDVWYVRSMAEQSAGVEVEESRRVGIKEVAQALGMSIGTVDRALHNRRGISPLTRQRVLRMAENLGYRPNLAARSLKFGKALTFSINLPQEIASFYDGVREGIRL